VAVVHLRGSRAAAFQKAEKDAWRLQFIGQARPQARSHASLAIQVGRWACAVVTQTVAEGVQPTWLPADSSQAAPALGALPASNPDAVAAPTRDHGRAPRRPTHTTHHHHPPPQEPAFPTAYPSMHEPAAHPPTPPHRLHKHTPPHRPTWYSLLSAPRQRKSGPGSTTQTPPEPRSRLHSSSAGRR
jgi:hypothetical protein